MHRPIKLIELLHGVQGILTVSGGHQFNPIELIFDPRVVGHGVPGHLPNILATVIDDLVDEFVELYSDVGYHVWLVLVLHSIVDFVKPVVALLVLRIELGCVLLCEVDFQFVVYIRFRKFSVKV